MEAGLTVWRVFVLAPIPILLKVQVVNLPKVHQLSGRKWTADVRSRCPLLAESRRYACMAASDP